MEKQPPVCEDAELARRTAAGDAGAFQALTVRYYRPVCAFLWKRVRQADAVEDLAQETFLEALRSLKLGRVPDHLSSWLFGIASNCCGKWLRRKKPALFDPAELPERAEEGSDPLAEAEEARRQSDRLEGGLAALPEEVRQLLDMKHRQGRTCEQIAAETGRPVGTVKSLLARAYKQLRERLGGAGGNEP